MRRIVLTRTREQCELWRRQLTEQGHEVLSLPLIRFELVRDGDGLDPDRYDWILFTSPQGVRAFAEHGYARDLSGSRPRLAALGAGTAAAMTEHELFDTLDLRCRDGREFAECFCEHISPPARILLPGPAKRRSEPAEILTAAGFEIHPVTLYRTVAVSPAELPDDPFEAGDLLFFASPSAVKAFGAAYPGRNLPSAAIGETSAAAARALGFEPVVAEAPNLADLCRAAGLSFEEFPNREGEPDA